MIKFIKNLLYPFYKVFRRNASVTLKTLIWFAVPTRMLMRLPLGRFVSIFDGPRAKHVYLSQAIVRDRKSPASATDNAKNCVILINGFKLDGADSHLKIVGELAILAHKYADVHICVSNINSKGCFRGEDKELHRQKIVNELQAVCGTMPSNVFVHVLCDDNTLGQSAADFFEGCLGPFPVIDTLFVVSGTWRAWFVEKTFLAKTQKAYFAKLGRHNPSTYLDDYDGLLSLHPMSERLPEGFSGSKILWPVYSNLMASTEERISTPMVDEERKLQAIKEISGDYVIVTVTKNLDKYLESNYYWVIDNLNKHFDGKVSIVIVGSRSDIAAKMIAEKCSDNIKIIAFDQEPNLPRMYRLLAKNLKCIYIYPFNSAAGYCKVLASRFMPIYVFDLDNPQMAPESRCVCREQMLFKCIDTFENYPDDDAHISVQINAAQKYSKYSERLVKLLITGMP